MIFNYKVYYFCDIANPLIYPVLNMTNVLHVQATANHLGSAAMLDVAVKDFATLKPPVIEVLLSPAPSSIPSSIPSSSKPSNKPTPSPTKVICQAGSFTTNDIICQPCPAGSFQSNTGATECSLWYELTNTPYAPYGTNSLTYLMLHMVRTH